MSPRKPIAVSTNFLLQLAELEVEKVRRAEDSLLRYIMRTKMAALDPVKIDDLRLEIAARRASAGQARRAFTRATTAGRAADPEPVDREGLEETPIAFRVEGETIGHIDDDGELDVDTGDGM